MFKYFIYRLSRLLHQILKIPLVHHNLFLYLFFNLHNVWHPKTFHRCQILWLEHTLAQSYAIPHGEYLVLAILDDILLLHGEFVEWQEPGVDEEHTSWILLPALDVFVVRAFALVQVGVQLAEEVEVAAVKCFDAFRLNFTDTQQHMVLKRRG